MRISNFSLLQMKNAKSNENGSVLMDFGVYLALDLESRFWSAEVDLCESVQRSWRLEKNLQEIFLIILVKLYWYFSRCSYQQLPSPFINEESIIAFLNILEHASAFCHILPSNKADWDFREGIISKE